LKGFAANGIGALPTATAEAGPESDALKSVRLFHLGLSVFIRGLIWNTEGA